MSPVTGFLSYTKQLPERPASRRKPYSADRHARQVDREPSRPCGSLGSAAEEGEPRHRTDLRPKNAAEIESQRQLQNPSRDGQRNAEALSIARRLSSPPSFSQHNSALASAHPSCTSVVIWRMHSMSMYVSIALSALTIAARRVSCAAFPKKLTTTVSLGSNSRAAYEHRFRCRVFRNGL